MYNMPIDELKSKHTPIVIARAVARWMALFEVDVICDRIDMLQGALERAGKKEFIKIYEFYVKGENKCTPQQL